MANLGKIRRSQVITTYGPGAVVDFRADDAPVSAVTMGLDAWEAHGGDLGRRQTICEVRLQNRLRVSEFRLPPVVPESLQHDGPAVPAVRFPQMGQCSKCNRLLAPIACKQRLGHPGLYCPDCSTAVKNVPVVPVRFVVSCPDGHLDDFPWGAFAEHAEGCTRRAPLYLVTRGAGLAGLHLRCGEEGHGGCGQEKSLGGIFTADPGSAPVRYCSGRSLWLGPDARTQCEEQPRVLQRGASNLYFPQIASALDIPPYSDRLQAQLMPHWEMLRNAHADGQLAMVVGYTGLAAKFGLDKEDLVERIRKRIEGLTDSGGAEQVRFEEYQVLTERAPDGGAIDEDAEFETRHEHVPVDLAPWFSSIVRVTRLREVRALLGFTRIQPPGPWNGTGEKEPGRCELSQPRRNWLPATEVRGEGIFLELSARRITDWTQQEEIARRSAHINDAFRARWKERHEGKNPPFAITARHVLVHSFAHALMRQLSLACGYSAASLRERLYVGDGEHEMSGLLIYTAASDSDGTLGGLVRLGKADRLPGIIKAALQDMMWCSSDPLCSEGRHSLSEPENLAACHACMMAAESSCEEFNVRLDRVMLTGTATHRELGFFDGLFEEA